MPGLIIVQEPEGVIIVIEEKQNQITLIELITQLTIIIIRVIIKKQ